MGQVETRGFNRPEDEDEPMFVIPPHVHLSRTQNAMLLSSGQQRGVPFSVNQGGAFRPETNSVKVKYTYSNVALTRNSVQLKNIGGAKYSLNFKYSSSAEAATQVVIFVNAKDKSTSATIRFDEKDIESMWGPINLSPGYNISWSSESINKYISEYQLPSIYSDDVIAGLYDVVICFSSKNDRFSAVNSSKPSYAVNTNKSKLSITESQSTSPSVLGKLTSILFTSDKTVAVDSSQPSPAATVTRRGSSCTNRNRSVGVIHDENVVTSSSSRSSSVGSGSLSRRDRTPDFEHHEIFDNDDIIDGIRMKGNIKLKTGATSNKHKKVDEHVSRAAHRSNIINLMGEVSYFRAIRSSTSKSTTHENEADSSRTLGNPNIGGVVDLKLINQRVQLADGPYIIQEAYGVDYKALNGKNFNAETSRCGKVVDGDNDVGSGESECVICLTDPRCIMVYPCRHMCLCSTCADSLSSQGNKCPICRRLAIILLRVKLSSETQPSNNEALPSRIEGTEHISKDDSSQAAVL